MLVTQSRTISRTLRANIDILNRELGVGNSFDLLCRQLNYGGRDFALSFIDGFAKDDIMNRIIEHLSMVCAWSMIAPVHAPKPTFASRTSKTSPTPTSSN